MVTRVTNQAILTRAVDRMTRRYARLDRATSDATTGRSMHRVSDDPGAMSRVLGLDGAERARRREISAAVDAEGLLNAADASLQTIMTRMQRVRQLAVSGANDRSAAERASMAEELDSIQTELVGLANTRQRGRRIFGGNEAGPAVSGAGTTFTYDGDAGAALRTVGENDTVEANVLGSDAFWFTPPAGFSDNLFAVVGDVSAAIAAGDSGRAAASLEAIDAAMAQVGRQLAVVGARTNYVEAARARADQLAFALRNERSELADVDLAEAIVRLRTEETAYQAALSAVARSMPPGLAAFLS